MSLEFRGALSVTSLPAIYKSHLGVRSGDSLRIPWGLSLSYKWLRLYFRLKCAGDLPGPTRLLYIVSSLFRVSVVSALSISAGMPSGPGAFIVFH